MIVSNLTDNQIERTIQEIIKHRSDEKNHAHMARGFENLLKHNGIELEFTPEGVLWKVFYIANKEKQ